MAIWAIPLDSCPGPRIKPTRNKNTVKIRPAQQQQISWNSSMNIMVTLVLITSMCVCVSALNAADRQPASIEIYLAHVVDQEGESGAMKFVFVVNNSVAFSTVNGLKKYIKELPEKSVVSFNVGDDRIGGEPLVSNKKEMDDLKLLCEKAKVTLKIVGGG